MENTSQQIEELKELVRRNTALSEDTNRMMHSMRRTARWGMIVQMIWWLTVLGITGAAYYYYVSPYVAKIEVAYHQAQAAGAQANNYSQEAAQFFQNLFTPNH